MSKTTQKRQGDIFFETCEAPKNLKQLQKKKDGTLYHGEVTGHSHAIDDIDMDKVDIYVDQDGQMFVHAKEDVGVGHDEHDTVTLEKGQWWKASRQREYDPILDHNRIVAD